jgi:hypothetical protein
MADPKTRYMANYIFGIQVKLHRNEIESTCSWRSIKGSEIGSTCSSRFIKGSNTKQLSVSANINIHTRN